MIYSNFVSLLNPRPVLLIDEVLSIGRLISLMMTKLFEIDPS